MGDQQVDVIICGCGPTGAMLACYLGQMNIRCIILEKEGQITTDPRGIALDEDGIRIAQGVGIYDKIYTEIGSCLGKFLFIGSETSDFMHPPLTIMDYATTEGGTGHVGFILHKQPILEKNIRESMSSHPSVDFRPNSTVTGISEDKESVYVTYKDLNGYTHHVSGKFLVGADGKTGYTRKTYLEPKGIIMRNSSSKYQATWVAINLKITLPTPETHPEFPLWEKGYTPEEVYDSFFPKEFRILCNPKRPAVCSRFGLREDRMWRFEFVVTEDEDGMELSKPANMSSIVFPYLTHPGTKYALDHKYIQYPNDCIEVLRSRPFGFAARECNKWALGRTILVGDSCHVFPPFGGQGIASGFRDASSLAWRLAIASRPGFEFDENLFVSWYEERKQQLHSSLRATVENGDLVTENNPLRIFVRDWIYWAMQLIPSVRRWLEKGQRRYGMTKYEYRPGLTFIPGPGSGVFLPQVYCLPLNKPGKQIAFTDDIIFAPQKNSLFQVVVFLSRVSDIYESQRVLADVDSLSEGELSTNDTTYIVLDTREKSITDSSLYVCRVATGEEFAKSPLCISRPEPRYYDEFRIATEVHNKKYIIIRPDRLVYAACDNKVEIDDAARSLANLCGHTVKR